MSTEKGTKETQKEFLKVKEVAARLNCSIPTIYRLLEKKKILATRAFGPWLIFKKEFERKIEMARNENIFE